MSDSTMGDSAYTVLVVVPARGGSKGLPGKNLMTVAGVSLVGRAVVRAREFVAANRLGDRASIVVDTDDPSIAEEGRRWGASVPFLRPATLAADDTSTADSLAHLIEYVEGSWTTVVLLQPTSPLARASDVSACWEHYVSAELPSVVSTVGASHPPALALVEDEAGRLRWWAGRPPDEVRRQGQSPSVHPSGAVYVVDVPWFLEHRRFISAGETGGVALDAARAVDVDELRDLELARLQALFARDPGPVDSDAEVDRDVRGTDDVRQTVERVLERIEAGRKPAAVRFGGAAESGPAQLAQIPAIRSIFGLSVVWEAAVGSRDTARAARMLGARVVGEDETPDDGGPLEPGWFDTLRSR